jgi:hypothetical protein
MVYTLLQYSTIFLSKHGLQTQRQRLLRIGFAYIHQSFLAHKSRAVCRKKLHSTETSFFHTLRPSSVIIAIARAVIAERAICYGAGELSLESHGRQRRDGKLDCVVPVLGCPDKPCGVLCPGVCACGSNECLSHCVFGATCAAVLTE